MITNFDTEIDYFIFTAKKDKTRLFKQVTEDYFEKLTQLGSWEPHVTPIKSITRDGQYISFNGWRVNLDDIDLMKANGYTTVVYTTKFRFIIRTNDYRDVMMLICGDEPKIEWFPQLKAFGSAR